MKELKTNEFKSSVYDLENEQSMNDGLVVVDFYAEWCQPCKNMTKSLTELEKEFTNVTFVKINAEDEYELTEFFQIRNLPTLIFISPKGEIYSESGLLPKPLLSKKIQQYTSLKELV